MVLMAAMVLTAMRAGAAEPPETMNLHRRDGRVTTVAFTAFNHMAFSGGNAVLTGRNAPVSVKLADISKITFGERYLAFYIPVTFGLAGSGGGAIYASVVEDGRTFYSGAEIKAGLRVRFRAVPNTGYTVKGWRVNGSYTSGSATEKTILLDKDRYATGLKVEVEFAKEEAAAEILVTFGVTGDGSGKLSAFIVENGTQTQRLNSGERVAAGRTVLLKAEPGRDAKIKGWRINGSYTSGSATEKRILLDKNQHASGLKVEVEFTKKVGLEETEALGGRLNVYVQHREIGIESTAGIERVELLDVGGHLLRVGTYARGTLQAVLPAGEVEAGLYILKIRTTEREEIRKVIIR